MLNGMGGLFYVELYTQVAVVVQHFLIGGYFGKVFAKPSAL